MKVRNSWLAWVLGSDETIRRWSHRVAALVLIAVGLYHVGYLSLTNEGRRLIQDFFRGRR